MSSDRRQLELDGEFRYAKRAEKRDALQLPARYELELGDQTISEDRYAPVRDVLDAELLADVPMASERQIERAVQLAAQSAVTWAAQSGVARAKRLLALAHECQREAARLSLLATLESGLPIATTRARFELAARGVRHYAGWADKLEFKLPARSLRALGVAVQVALPAAAFVTVMRRAAAALACGTAVILLPPLTTPLVAFELRRLARRAGFPAGVFNVLTTDTGAEATLALHADVAHVSAPGDAPFASELRASMKRYELHEYTRGLQVVFADSALDQAALRVVEGAFVPTPGATPNARCVLVEESVAGPFLQKLHDLVVRLRVGDPLDHTTQIGPMIDALACDEARAFVARAVQAGARAVCAPSGSLGARYLPPTVLSNVAPHQSAVREEPPAHVLAVLTFRTDAEAQELAQRWPQPFVLAVWSSRGARVLDWASRSAATTIWCNAYGLSAPQTVDSGRIACRPGDSLFSFVEVTRVET